MLGYQQYLRYKWRNGSANSSAQEGSRHSSCSKWCWIHLFKGMVIKFGVFSRVLWKNGGTFLEKCVKHSLTPLQGLNALLSKESWIRHWFSLFRDHVALTRKILFVSFLNYLIQRVHSNTCNYVYQCKSRD